MYIYYSKAKDGEGTRQQIGDRNMTYTEAIDLARAGEERGYGFLYEKTYKSKYYLALQYMKNEEEAEDVLQEAYIKAFSSILLRRECSYS